MKNIRISLIIIVMIPLFSNFLYSLTSQSHHGTCPKGSALRQWTSTWTYDDKGRPVTGSGIDCDGNPWNVDLRETYSGNTENDSVAVGINTLEENFVDVSANYAPLKYRIIDIQTGNWVSDEISYQQPGLPLQINISQLTSGLYGIVVILDNTPISLLEFLK